jgi:hypothetical protein
VERFCRGWVDASRLRLGIGLAIGALGLLGAALPATAAACPNDAVRLGPSAQLPECRAYEMVSPVDKAGGGVYSLIPPQASTAGGALEFYSNASFAGSEGAALAGAYVAHRGATDWSTESIDAPQENLEVPLELPSPASSPDLSKTIQLSRLALTPGATEGGSNLYLRDNRTGARQLIFTSPSVTFFNDYTQPDSGPLVVGGSADWSHIVLSSEIPLTADAPEGKNLYDYSGGALRIVNYIPAPGGGEEIAPGASTATFTPYSRAVSADGSRIFFTAAGSLFMREGDARTVPISVSQAPGTEGTLLDGESPRANRAGTLVYFTSYAALTADAADCGHGSACLYRYDVGSGKLLNVTPVGGPEGPKVNQVFAVSEDGSSVVFSSGEALTTDAPEVEYPDVDLYENGPAGLRFISRYEIGDPGQWEMSPSGRYFAFATYLPLSAEDQPGPTCVGGIFVRPEEGACLDVYTYDAVAGTLTCATCNGAAERGDSSLGGQFERRPNNLDDEYPRAVLDDGSVFVNTPNRLSPLDLNAVEDVYRRRGAEVTLLSPGTSESPAQFADASADGGDVYFATAQRLVGQDVDGGIDIYDARVDGGLAAQWPPTAPATCSGEGCRAASPGAPPTLPFGSGAAEAERCTAPAASASAAAKRAAALRRRAAKLAHRGGRKAKARARKLRHQAAGQQGRAKKLRQQATNCQEAGR